MNRIFVRSLICTVFSVLWITETLHSQDLGPSWKDQSLQALGAGDLDSARFYLERWLQADPRDESSWYNLACVYALQDQPGKALDAWENAVEAGWDDPDHPLNDGDLESIRSDARFTAALDKVRQKEAETRPRDHIRNFLRMESVGTYITALPDDYENSDHSYPLCVILHGSGSSETGHGGLADLFGRDGVIYIAPRAPYTHTSSYKNSGTLGFTAWTPEQIDSLDPLYNEVPKMYASWIMECVRDAQQRYRISNAKPIILGHSQGAAFSWITASLYPEQVGSIFAYAGYFPDQFTTDERLEAIRHAGVRITLAHGAADNVVDPEGTREIAQTLEEWSIPCTLTEYEDTGHGISQGVVDQMKAWIDTETGRPSETDAE